MKQKIILLLLLCLICTIFAFDGAKYLIIAPDNYVQYVQPLANWKTKKGIKAYIAPLSITGNSSTQIKTYIVNAVNNWRIKPEYILLVGSGGLIPSSSLGGGEYSDDYYADITGDYKIELSIGRLPCTNTTQCQTNVAKTLENDRTPYMTDTTWYRKGTTIVREDGSIHPDTIYWNNVRYIHSFWRNQFTTIDSLSYQRGDDRNDVVNAINNGRIYVVYRGEATVTWYTPFQVNVSQTTNGFKLPIIISGTCATMSLSFQTGYLGDNFLNTGTASNPRGAVGFFGSSVAASGSGLAWQRGTVTKGFFTALYTNNCYKLGDASKRAKFILDSIRPPYYSDIRYKEWNLFGDPELNLWTAVPKKLTVQHDTLIITHPQYFTVNVQRAGNPVSGALVCLMMDTLIYECSYTNNSGQATFLINPSSAGTMSVTITAQNCIPYEKNVTVNLGSIDHDVGVVSIIEPQGTIALGTNVIPRVKIKNFGTHSDSFPVSFKIGTIYDQTITSITLSPGDTTTISFPVWSAVIGTHSVLTYTYLSSDEWRGNDTAVSLIYVVITQDVGVDAVLSPDSIHLINTSLTPKTRIKNYGTLTQTNFSANCSIIGSDGAVRYTDTKTITSLASNDTVRINFINWTPNISEVCTVKIRTNLIGDQNLANDLKTKITRIISTSIAEEKIPKLSSITVLHTPKPNPITSGSAQVSFNLAEPTKVALRIFDATGKLIKTIVNTQLHDGIYNYTWNGRDETNQSVDAGIYFCTLETIKQKFTKKIIFTR